MKNLFYRPDVLDQKRQALDDYTEQFNCSVQAINNTIEDLTKQSQMIQETIEDINRYEAELDSTRIGLEKARSRSLKVLDNFKALLAVED